MLTTNSLDLSKASIRQLIWIEAFYEQMQNFQLQKKKFEVYSQIDKKFLLMDIANSQRLKLSMGKSSSILRQKDLPSVKVQTQHYQPTIEQKKRFLQKLNRTS